MIILTRKSASRKSPGRCSAKINVEYSQVIRLLLANIDMHLGRVTQVTDQRA